ncbi:MAG TPA: cysteine synthase family protein [Gemmataceae bacterium]|nr:cysteine synthase family protein [Gemmataceae bacterium]
MIPAPSILDRIGNTPMVQLKRVTSGPATPIYGKCEFLNPGGSVKDRIALAIVNDAEERGVLKPDMTLIEATAGNTGIGLAMIAAIRGYRLVCVMPEKMSMDKRTALTAVGAEVMMVPNAPLSSSENFQNVARRLAAERGWFLTDQFANPANPCIHETTTGPEVLAQCGGHVGAFVCGVGTGGTITGVGLYLKTHCPGVCIVMADPVGSRLAHFVDPRHPDRDAAYAMEGIGGSRWPVACDPNVIDEAEPVADEEAFAMTRRLIAEEGLLVGASSGAAVVAALRVAARGCAGPVVALLADSWDRYLSRPWMQAASLPAMPAIL